MKRILFTAAMAALTASASLLPAQVNAQVRVDVAIGNPPPPVRYEAAPTPRRGYVWAPGYWNWNGRRYVWASGHWERDRPGYAYRRPEWRQVGNQWRLERGGWDRRARDRDGDGVPNRFDSRPNNPHRR